MTVESALNPAAGAEATRAHAAAQPAALSRIAALVLLVAALGGYLWLAVRYVEGVPAWEAPDETGHFAYVRYLVVEHALPNRTVGGGNEFHQPPLAYLAGALLVADLNTELFERIKPNPAFIWSRRGDAPNAVLHTRDEAPPYPPLYEALHRLRLLSVLFGAGCVLATFATARVVFPRRPLLAAIAALFVAYLPQFVFATAVVNNDALAFLLCALATLSLARIVTGRDTSLGEHLRLGLWLGLGLLTKVNVFAVAGVAAAAVLWCAWRAPDRPAALGRAAWAGAVAALVGGGWYLRNLLIYRGLFANQTYVDDQTLPQIAAYGFGPSVVVEQFLRPLFESSFAQFGWMTLKAEPGYYAGWGALLAASAVGVALWPLRPDAGETAAAGERAAARRAVVVLGLLLLAPIALILLRWITTIGNHYPQGRYLFLALPAAAVLVATGLDTVTLRRAPLLVALLLGAGLFAASTNLLGVYADPRYRPLDLWLEPPAAIERPVGQVLGDQLHLLGYDLDRPEVPAGGRVTLRLYWQALASPPTDYHVFVHLALPSDEPVAQHDAVPGPTGYPPVRWLPGDVLLDAHPLELPTDLPPGRYRLLVGAYRFPELVRLPATAPADGRDYLEIDALTITPR